MKVLVTGNCQSPVFANCLRLMSPDWEVKGDQLHLLKTSIGELINWADCIYTQHGFQQNLIENGADASKIRLFPRFSFWGLHPDAVYAGPTDQRINTPIGPMNPLIGLLAYSQGMDVEQTAGLYNAQTFKALGYFDRHDVDYASLMKEAQRCGVDLSKAFARWSESGCFCYGGNHPRIDVMRDIAAAVLERDGIRPPTLDILMYIPDIFSVLAVIPVYPEIAERHGFKGSYFFSVPAKYVRQENLVKVLNLREYLSGCFKIYDDLDFGALFQPARFMPRFQEALQNQRSRVTTGKHPYKGLPDHQNWRKSVAGVAPSQVDPVVKAKFRIATDDLVATAGSCFAQHVSRALVRNGLRYYVAEAAAPDVSEDEARRRNFGVYSARYGNLYTPRQLLQLIARAYDEFDPQDTAWQRPDGRFADPFRPEIEPDGFATPEAVDAARVDHLASVRTMIETADVFVFTMGLTEGWRRKSDGAVFPLAPGVVAGDMSDAYEFVNFGVSDVVEDIKAALAAFRQRNSNCRFLLTVSPVPLVATYEPMHVLSATTYSKSVLRAAAGEVSRTDSEVDYFPSYEVITGNFNRGGYFEDDLRSVKPEGVEHVMRLFMEHMVDSTLRPSALSADEELSKAMMDVVCEEEKLDA